MNLVLDHQPWMEDAICPSVDPEAFFPEKGAPPFAARRICQTCPVQAECLQYALDNELNWGIFGGLTMLERRKLKVRPARPKACSVDGCDKPHHSHGYCNTHALRARRRAA